MFGLIEMVVAQYLFLGAQELKERAGEDGLYFVEAGLNWAIFIKLALHRCISGVKPLSVAQY